MTLEDELNSLLLQLPAKAPVETPPAPAAPTLDTHVTPPVDPAPVEAPKVVTPPVAQTPPVATPEPSLDEPVDDWELDTPKPAEPAPTTLDIQAIAKELGVENVKTKEDLVKTLSELKIKAEAASKNIEVLPEDLAKAVDIAKQGGNYLEYLKVSAVDWQKQDPVLLFENWVYDRMAKQNKTAEEIDAYLDKIDDIDKELRGQELQAQYINYQNQQRMAIENQAKAEKQQFEASARAALNSISDIYGFKLNQSHRDSLYHDFTSTPVGKALLAQSGGDFKSALEGLFNVKYGAKIDQFRKQQLKNSVKRDLLNELQNPKITVPANVTTPVRDEKVDPIKTYLSELQVKMGL